MTFLELAEKILYEAQKPLSSSEIWHVAVDKGYDKLLVTGGKTPWASLGAQIHVNERDNPRTPFRVIGSRPKRFYLKQLDPTIDLARFEDAPEISLVKTGEPSHFLERELHQFLAYFAYYHLRCHTKTINHSRSNKKEFGEWVHPDIVGCYFPIDEWKRDVFEFSAAIGNISIKLLSFELKRELGFGNLRESFFQAVSNSSWANEGYLVTASISRDEDFLAELTMLSTSFGIGVILLNIKDPDSSEILLPAKVKDNLDWETINKLAMNRDFEEFLRRIKTDLTSREVRKEKYDQVLDLEALIQWHN